MNAITCDDLVFRRGDRTVLNRIGFELAPGRLLGLIGHNGAGKSTLIKLILGLLKPASGRLEVLGGAPGASPLDVGYLPENVSFYDAMTVEEHLRYFAGLKGVARPRIDELVEELGLGVVLRQRLGQCSKGQRQRLGLAQALLTRPRLLMLDEPTVGLDPAASSLMYRELSALRDAGCAVVVCTHELALVEPYLDQVLLLATGECRGSGTLEDLRAKAALPALITNVGSGDALADPELAPYVRGTRLAVPEGDVARVVRRLTEAHGGSGHDLRALRSGRARGGTVMTSSTSSAIGTGSRIGALATVSIVAGKEFRDCLRSRWLVFGSALFAILGLAVFFGTAAIGGTLQYQPLPSVMNSLLSLTVFLLPLLALLLSYDAFVGEAESGTLLLMLTYPLSRLQWLAGKALGQGAALLLVLVLGFAVLPLIQAFLPVPYGMGELLSSLCVLVLSGWALGLLFMLAAYWVSLSVRHKAQALALLLVVWFVAVLLYDLGLLVVTVAGADVLGRGTLTALMLANPASVFRLLNQSVIGVLSFEVPSAAVLSGILAAWIAVLFAICARTLAVRRL